MSAGLLLLGAAAIPVLITVALAGRVSTRRLRTFAVCAAAAMAVLLLVIALFAPREDAGEQQWLSISALSAPLLPLPATLWITTLLLTPNARLDRAGIARTAWATLWTTLAFMTQASALLLVAWGVSSWLLLQSLAAPAHAHARRVAALYLGVSTGLLAGGVGLQAWGQGPLGSLGSWLIAGAVLMRKGVFPFHAWIPEVFDSGRIGPALLFSAPQLGSYVALVLMVPSASLLLLDVVARLSLVTAVYGAALAVAQRDVRRACGYLFVSQSALVLAGLDGANAEALAGALVLWLSSALAFAALGRSVLALEARCGRMDLGTHHGAYQQAPWLAVSFLVLGMACAGFPGTLGFVGQEMLVDGAVNQFPSLGFLVIGASTLTGIAVLRMYFSLFCGPSRAGPKLNLLRREAAGLAVTILLLIVGGIVPAALVQSRVAASRALLDRRLRPGAAEQQHSNDEHQTYPHHSPAWAGELRPPPRR